MRQTCFFALESLPTSKRSESVSRFRPDHSLAGWPATLAVRLPFAPKTRAQRPPHCPPPSAPWMARAPARAPGTARGTQGQRRPRPTTRPPLIKLRQPTLQLPRVAPPRFSAPTTASRGGTPVAPRPSRCQAPPPRSRPPAPVAPRAAPSAGGRGRRALRLPVALLGAALPPLQRRHLGETAFESPAASAANGVGVAAPPPATPDVCAQPLLHRPSCEAVASTSCLATCRGVACGHAPGGLPATPNGHHRTSRPTSRPRPILAPTRRCSRTAVLRPPPLAPALPWPRLWSTPRTACPRPCLVAAPLLSPPPRPATSRTPSSAAASLAASPSPGPRCCCWSTARAWPLTSVGTLLPVCADFAPPPSHQLRRRQQASRAGPRTATARLRTPAAELHQPSAPHLPHHAARHRPPRQ